MAQFLLDQSRERLEVESHIDRPRLQRQDLDLRSAQAIAIQRLVVQALGGPLCHVPPNLRRNMVEAPTDWTSRVLRGQTNRRARSVARITQALRLQHKVNTAMGAIGQPVLGTRATMEGRRQARIRAQSPSIAIKEIVRVGAKVVLLD